VVNGLPPAVGTLIGLALEEDLGRGDATSCALVDAARTATATIIAKEPLVLSGLDLARAVFEQVSPQLRVTELAADGERVTSGQTVMQVAGPARPLLGAERTALNFVQHLSGVATLTRRFVDEVAGTRARVVDTRKTLPGFRWLEKRAVRHGGGFNHRADLAAGVLIKDNHVALYGVRGAVERARASAPHGLRIEVEVTTMAELEEALAARAEVVLLDNLRVEQVAQAVARVAGRALVEISGGVGLDTVRALAETGADVISIGRLTHSAPAVDLSLELVLTAS
jgi:nicotinate-nucleotide pyrophosphorylase (carboxylating)